MRTETARVLLGVLLALFIVSFNVAQSGNPTAFGTSTLPCTIETYGTVWNGTFVYGLFQYNFANLSQRLDRYLVFAIEMSGFLDRRIVV